MKNVAIIIAATAAVALTCVLPAAAQQGTGYRYARNPHCVDRAIGLSLPEMLFSTGPAPQANGCAPAVYSGGRFVGQDPDPNVRLQLQRDSDNEGYHLNTR
jgi:hypothetical protein